MNTNTPKYTPIPLRQELLTVNSLGALAKLTYHPRLRGSLFSPRHTPVDPWGLFVAGSSVQTFQAFTSDLIHMSSLIALGIKTVTVESTGICWVTIFEVLGSKGADVILANVREARTVPGRKSDVNDTQWSRQSPSN
jgi:hypothetical protein